MNRQKVLIPIIMLVIQACTVMPSIASAKDVVRPEEIRSMRQVVYDQKTYTELAGLWKDYCDEYPSEYAYANWMYAARYAHDAHYSELLSEGILKYPANPILLYLKALELHGSHDNVEGRKYLEQAVALDPNYTDPWFALVTHYMDNGDEERLDLALRRLLESGIITDDVMDFNYNMLISLEKNAILITNGDNDTFPGWILTRILKVRPDVAIINRSLLNTDWYPMYVIKQGLPRFIGKTELDDLRESIIKQMKDKSTGMPPGGPFGDTLIDLIVRAAQRSERPVYFSKTLYMTDKLKEIAGKSRELGLVALVTTSSAPYAEQLRDVCEIWIEDFRAGGLDSWRLHSAAEADAGRMLVSNYGAAAMLILADLKKYAPDLRTRLFNWYVDHVEELLIEKMRYNFAQGWCCAASDIPDIESWCKAQGVKCEQQTENSGQ